MLVNFSLKSFLLAVIHNRSTDLTATFQDSDHWGLVLGSSSGDSTTALRYRHVASFIADEGFVNFDMAAGLVDLAIMKRHADTVIHEPR
jgi:hypothetical protein